MEHVNHPKHYNSHPNGIECIDIIRHYVCDIANAIKYLWRAGLKAEMGMENAEKEIEDLKSRIRSCLSDLNRVAEAPYELTVSIGAAKAEKDMPLKLLIEKADAALYEDKRH